LAHAAVPEERLDYRLIFDPWDTEKFDHLTSGLRPETKVADAVTANDAEFCQVGDLLLIG
jgi:hypothetical protein